MRRFKLSNGCILETDKFGILIPNIPEGFIRCWSWEQVASLLINWSREEIMNKKKHNL